MRTHDLTLKKIGKTILLCTELLLVSTVLSAWTAWGQAVVTPPSSHGAAMMNWSFGDNGPLTGWTLTGGAEITKAEGRERKDGALKVGPGSKALLKLREHDGSGKVELWVYDDGAKPENPKASRVGPRWGLVQSDGKLLAAGIFYASYLGGAEGYTATACDGLDWFKQLFWLGINRARPGWHKWTFDFDAEAGLQVLHNDKEVSAVDGAKTGLKGFNALVIWGDNGPGEGQTVLVDDISVTLGGPVTMVPAGEANPYDEKANRLGFISAAVPNPLYEQQRTRDSQAGGSALEGIRVAVRHHLAI